MELGVDFANSFCHKVDIDAPQDLIHRMPVVSKLR